MGLKFGKCCCCRKHNSIGTFPLRQLKVLLLGLPESGKTEVGHLISGIERVTDETTNGVQFFCQQRTDTSYSLCITEVGGNTEMQKIWHHYFLTCMGIIYCFDMSAEYGQLKRSFDLLRYILAHPFMRGKPVLLVATKSDLAREGLNLYDIENSFGLQSLANSFSSSLRMCYCNRRSKANLEKGVNWLTCTINGNLYQMLRRLRSDKNFKMWEQQIYQISLEANAKENRTSQRLSRKIMNSAESKISHDRPMTAPAYTIICSKLQGDLDDICR